MPLPVIANTYRVVFNWTGTDSDENVVSVQHFNFTGTEAQLAAHLNDNLQLHMLEGLLSTTEVTTVDITALDGVSGAQSFPLTTWSGETGSGDTLPGFNILVLGSTGLRGPANRGRIFLPSPIEAVITDGLLDAANAVEINDAWTDFVAAMAADAANWGVASYVNATFNAYTTVTVPRMLGVIRRRRNVT